MEYIDLIRKFWRFNKENPLNCSVTTLYLFLLQHWDNNQKQDFELSDREAIDFLKISRRTILSSKKALRDLGLINYRTIKGLPNRYKIIPDYIINEQIADKIKSQKKVVKEKKTVIESLIPETLPIDVPIAQQQQNTKISYPTKQEFMEYAKTLSVYTPELDFALESKYDTWVSEGWINGYGNPITNWRNTLRNTIPYLGKKPDIFNIPRIKKPMITQPKSTYDE